MRLFIQIPCYNEEATLPMVLADLPKSIPGIDDIEVMVVDDGSTDRTSAVAEALGVRHIVRQVTNQGLATAFRRGVEYALANGADILVNTDGDNQYFGGDIEKLCAPIIAKQADLVVGCRPIKEHLEFSLFKKLLQLSGSCILRWISKTNVRDAASGFRAFSRETLLRIFIHSKFSYCMETLIQAGNCGIRVASVDIRVNPQTRDSRLFKNIPQYLRKSGGTMLAMFALYRPGRFFATASLAFWLTGLAIGGRAIYLRYTGDGLFRDHLSSLLLLVICVLIAIMLDALAVIGELMKAQRRLTEEVIYFARTAKFDSEDTVNQ